MNNELTYMDANLGASNHIENQEMRDIIQSTLDDIAKVLEQHCGPYGKFALLANPSNLVEEPVFTKDGIGIVRSLDYANPIQQFVKSVVAYMGSRLETAAGDGTTSAMLILIRGIQFLVQELGDKNCYTFSEIKRAYETFCERITNRLKHNCYSYTKKNTRETVWNIAYSQAWTSTHGDPELSEAIAELFSKTPPEAWNYLSIDKAALENNTPYLVETDTSQYKIDHVQIWPETAKTENLGLSRTRAACNVILSGMAPGYECGNLEAELLYQDIMNALETNTSLTVICPRTIDNVTQNLIGQKFREHPSHDVCLFLIDDDDPRLNDIVCMKVLANQTDVRSRHTLDYEYDKGSLRITGGLYEKQDGALNKNVGNPNYKPLTDLVEHLDKVIAQVKSQVSNKMLNMEVRRLQKFHLKLTLTEKTYFRIGGSAYDNAAAVDVVLDAIIATKHSLQHGFNMAGNKSLWTQIYQEYKEAPKDDAKKDALQHTQLEYVFANAFYHAILLMHEAMLGQKLEYDEIPHYFQSGRDLTKFTRVKNWSGKERIANLLGNCTMLESIYELSPKSYRMRPAVIQPIDTDTELLKRFGELALKLVYTSKIVISGGLYRKVK